MPEMVARLCEADAEIERMHRAHVGAYDELLAHVWMGDVSRRVMGLYRRGLSRRNGGVSRATLRRVLAVLEDACRDGDETVRDVIGASFSENVAAERKVDPVDFASKLGPCLARQYRGIREAWGLPWPGDTPGDAAR